MRSAQMLVLAVCDICGGGCGGGRDNYGGRISFDGGKDVQLRINFHLLCCIRASCISRDYILAA